MEPSCGGVGCVALSLNVLMGMDRRHGHLTGQAREEQWYSDAAKIRRVEVVWEDGAVRWPEVDVVVPYPHCVVEGQEILGLLK